MHQMILLALPYLCLPVEKLPPKRAHVCVTDESVYSHFLFGSCG